MIKTHYKNFPGTPFRIEINILDNAEGTWQSNRVSIFRDNALIGEYLRNYPNFADLTFCPFFIDDVWYALYSANYTDTRVMRLYEDRVEDWCGDESSVGFCPVEIYVPKYASCDGIVMTDSEYTTVEEFLQNCKDLDWHPIEFCNFGFLCGCHWGDDSSWKLRFIDLSKIPDKILTISEKFGYWELPKSLTLRQCIDMSDWSCDATGINLILASSTRISINR